MRLRHAARDPAGRISITLTQTPLTSEAERDIIGSYQLHANCFITKPVDISQFLRVIKMLDDFWFSVVQLPSHRLAS